MTHTRIHQKVYDIFMLISVLPTTHMNLLIGFLFGLNRSRKFGLKNNTMYICPDNNNFTLLPLYLRVIMKEKNINYYTNKSFHVFKRTCTVIICCVKLHWATTFRLRTPRMHKPQ